MTEKAQKETQDELNAITVQVLEEIVKWLEKSTKISELQLMLNDTFHERLLKLEKNKTTHSHWWL